MSLWVFDTDTLTLWFHGHQGIMTRVEATLPSQLAITMITLEEILRGWYTQIRRARDDAQLARSYQALQQTVEFTRQVQILPFDLPAIRRFRSLRATHRRIGTNDLRIAAIVLEQGSILVTRNMKDFAELPGLPLADWSKMS